MQLTCQNCGEPIPSDNINIQQMTAVCPACHAVFQFDLPADKIKRRKVKHPPKLSVQESDERLNLAFRTSFRLIQNEAFLATAMMSVVFTFLSLMVGSKYLSAPSNSPATLVLAVGFGLVTLSTYYMLALATFNKTHIEVDDERIHMSRKPLPAIWNQPQDINVSSIERISYVETPASIREGYDMPRYNVWAETVDGGRKVVVSDVIDDYAIFIAQQINEYLGLDAGADISRLVDNGEIVDETFAPQTDSDHRLSI